jgi:GNAT superfamily N-acetyltransferase
VGPRSSGHGDPGNDRIAQECRIPCRRGGRLIGLCTAYLDLHSVRFGIRCWVEDLVVAPDRRSEGIGAALLARAREWAAGRGASHLELDTGHARADAQRFYGRQGEAHTGVSYSWQLSPTGGPQSGRGTGDQE